MKRRNFLLGVSGTAIGGSALLGTGAFSRIESQRDVTIQVAKDSHAYLGLQGCPDSPNRSYTNIDSSGHLEIDMSPSNKTDARGKGINSDSFTYFDNVFQICNNGKQPVCVWIDANANPKLELDSEYDDEDIVDFYQGSDREQSLVGPENAVLLTVGACICVGISTVTKGLEKGDKLIENDEIVIHADEDCPEEEIPIEDLGAICGEKRLTSDLQDYIEGLENGDDYDPDNPRAGWEIELFPDPELAQPPQTTTTEADGSYCFEDLAPGTYTVCEVPKPGSVQTHPEDGECYEVEVGEDETVEERDFENDLDDERPPDDDWEPRTIGFWSNWSGACTSGGQENVLGQTLADASGIDLGDLTVTSAEHAESPNCGAVRLLNKRDLDGNNRASDGAYSLVAQLLAAKLNRAAGAEVPDEGTGCDNVAARIDEGQALLDDIDFDGTGTYLPPNTARRQEALDIAACLDQYNNSDLV